MIRFVRAFAWLRLRLMVNGLRGRRSRDRVERISRLAAAGVPLLLGIAFAGTAASLAFGAAMAGWFAARGLLRPALLGGVTWFVLLILLGFLVVGSLGAGAPSGSVTTRLLILPISRRSLHAVRFASSFVEPWLLAVLPALVLLPAGLLAGGRPDAAVPVLAAGGALAAALAGIGSVLSLSMNWLMSGRKRSEAVTLIFVLLVSGAAIVPLLLGDSLERRIKASSREAKSASPELAREAAGASGSSRWQRALPNDLYSQVVRAGLEGRAGRAWLGNGLLLGEAVGLYFVSSAVHARLLARPEGGAAARRRRRALPARRLLPLASPEVSAVAIVQARNVLRSVRGRLAVLIPLPILLVLSIVVRLSPEELPFGETFARNGYMLLGVAVFFSLNSLQAFHFNQLASERAGLTLQFLSPLADRDLVRGKAIGGGLIYLVSLALCLASALAFAPGGSAPAWGAVLVGGLAAYVWLAPVAALLSALLPAAADLNKTGSGGNPHGLCMLVGSLLTVALAIPPGLILAVVHHGLGRGVLALALVAGWGLAGLAAAPFLLDLAARALAARRENVALVAQGG